MTEINTLYFIALREAAAANIGLACAEFAVDRQTAEFARDTDLPTLLDVMQTKKTLLRPTLEAKSLSILASAEPSQRRALATMQGA